MAGRVRHLLNRDGRYFARLVIPKDLKPFMDGKTELRMALGPDYRTALRKLPGAVAGLQDQLGLADKRRVAPNGEKAKPARYPLSVEQIAHRQYESLLAFDLEIRDHDPSYANTDVDGDDARPYRDGYSGKLSDDELEELVGDRIEWFRASGNTDAVKGTAKWRALAMGLCAARFEAIARRAERNEGDFTGKPSHPLIANAAPAEEPTGPTVTFDNIIDAEVKRRARGKDAKPLPDRTVKKYRDHAAEFAKWRRSNDASTVTAAEGKAWIEAMQEAGENGNRTVKMKFQNVRTILNWGREADPANLMPTGNPLNGIKTPDYQTTPSYLHAFTMDEAKLVLAAARQESKPMLRWIPWLCAYSGMRVSEAGKLRKEDFFKSDGRWFWKVTTVGRRTLKNHGSERRIPVHPALVEEGLIEFVEKAPAGRLFRGETKDEIDLQPRVGSWVRKLIPIKQHPELSPNHGWRHLFEDFCRRDRVSEDARHYITGRTDGKSQELYGRSDVMLPGLADAMDQIRSLAV